MVSRKPTSLTHIEAASVPVIAVTAWQALFDQAQLKAGRTVVIHGAAGNVGAYAVQLARRADVRITATAATDDILFLRNLGANTVIDYKTQRFEEEVRDADAVIDLVGGETQKRSFQVLRRGGKPSGVFSGATSAASAEKSQGGDWGDATCRRSSLDLAACPWAMNSNLSATRMRTRRSRPPGTPACAITTWRHGTG
jgi:NADPH:quinone reductase-like Zn-dependent oxidoreductase